jgi:peptidoglycan hydrolase CwlO-like protein/surface antigen
MNLMKQRSTTPVSKGLVTRSAIVAAAVLVMIASTPVLVPRVYADKFDDQINALQNEINQYESQAGQLRTKIGSLQDEIAGIDKQKNIIQRQIDLSQAKFDKLQEQIKQTEKSIKDNRVALGDTIADLYVDNTISPLEMLASSKNIGDYVDKQTYRSSVQQKLTQTIGKIKDLKTGLEKQKTAVQRTLADQNNSKKALLAKEGERSSLLAQTQGQESAYKNLAANREAQKLQVQQQQQAAIEAAIAAAGGGGGSAVILPGTTSYPWNSSNCYVDSNAWSYGGVDGNGTDGLGYGCRQCVSYVAWRVYKETGYAPVNWGNAYDWPSSAQSAGYQVSPVPRAHSAGVIMSGGSPGHIVWVESVDVGSGTMIVSQYNYYNAGGPGWGNYSKMQVPIGTYQSYIYF